MTIMRSMVIARRSLFVLFGIFFAIVLRQYIFCSEYVCGRLGFRSARGAVIPYTPCQDVFINDTSLPGSVALIVVSVASGDTSWVYDLPGWTPYLYTVNGPSANRSVPKNKGGESMAYLTYIIDNYHDLPDYSIFSHGQRYQWHNEDPMYDGLHVLQRLNLSSVAKHGYVNLRCSWTLGCPGVRPYRTSSKIEAFFEPNNNRANTEAAFAHAFTELFATTAPSHVAVPCSAQFAVTRKQIRQRSLCEYNAYRDWLLDTSLPDSVSGRIFEYSWHVIMRKSAVHCPPAQECFCETFGLCDLDCDEGSCRGRYWAPPNYRLPKEWPLVGLGTNGLPDWGWWEE